MLKTISWKFRKFHMEISPLIIFINGVTDGWGFDILNITHNLWNGSLLKVVINLPNGTSQRLSFNCDFLFLRNILIKKMNNISDKMIWGNANNLDVLVFWILKLIFK
jgi:hypothetical protein